MIGVRHLLRYNAGEPRPIALIAEDLGNAKRSLHGMGTFFLVRFGSAESLIA